MITDRDIAIRGVAEGKGPDAKISDDLAKNDEAAVTGEVLMVISKHGGKHCQTAH